MGKDIKERDIAEYLDEEVLKRGGETRKVSWEGRRGAPDKLVLLGGALCFVETKKPGQPATPEQAREHAKMIKLGGAKVIVAADPTVVDKLMYEMYDRRFTEI